MLTAKVFTLIYLFIALNLFVTFVCIFKSNDKNLSLTTLLITLSYTAIAVLLYFTSGELMDESIFTNNTIHFYLGIIIVITQLANFIAYFYKYVNNTEH